MMKLKNIIVLTIAYLVCLPLYSQDFSYFSEFKGAYFGIKSPGTSPLKFEVKGYFQFFNNGTECYFEHNGIWYSKLENGRWVLPVKTNIDYGAYADFEMNPSPTGDKILFNSIDRKLPDNAGEPFCPIWVSERIGNKWSKPEYTGVGGMYATCTNGGTLYYTIDKDGSSDIARSKFINDRYQESELITEQVFSDLYSDAHPYIAPDESFMIFDSNGRKMKNGCNLFISYRNKDGSWTKPVNMGEYINQKGGAALAYVTPDKKYIFYRTNGGIIYWISGTIIEDLNQKN
nr:hypothetical protein [Bacteroidota bacterium]